MKTTKEVTENYFQSMLANAGWEDLLTDQVTYWGPLASLVEGKEAVVQITQQFIQNKYKGEVKSILSEGNRACALTRYQLGHPDMATIDVDACEIIQVENGKIVSMEVYFDSLKVAQFGEKMKSMQPQG